MPISLVEIPRQVHGLLAMRHPFGNPTRRPSAAASLDAIIHWVRRPREDSDRAEPTIIFCIVPTIARGEVVSWVSPGLKTLTAGSRKRHQKSESTSIS